jgi:nitrilase
MVIDPWGSILAQKAEGEGVVVAEVDPEVTAKSRSMLPALEHRVL